MILSTIAQKDRQDFEFKLNTVEQMKRMSRGTAGREERQDG